MTNNNELICSVCLKPAVTWYYGDKKHNSFIYEHLDKKTCNTGRFMKNPMDAILKHYREENEK